MAEVSFVCLFLQNISQLSPDGPLPQLPLPYINNSETRVFFGHDRRPAEGYCSFFQLYESIKILCKRLHGSSCSSGSLFFNIRHVKFPANRELENYEPRNCSYPPLFSRLFHYLLSFPAHLVVLFPVPVSDLNYGLLLLS